jgi:hypothetical protein
VGWERRGEKLYYYRVFRTKDGVRKKYIGAGTRASEAAAEDDLRRQTTKGIRTRVKQEQRPLASLARELEEIDEQIEVMQAAQLLSRGWENHSREWRRGHARSRS